jgi:uncharacterized protein
MVWMQTYSGLAFDFDSDDLSQINIEDIAAHLSKICRFNGACKDFYSVAQHCVLISEELIIYEPKIQMFGLLHDAAEAYMGDIIRPLKNENLHSFEEKILNKIFNALHIPFKEYLVVKKIIKEADDRMLWTEKLQLMSESKRDWGWSAEPYFLTINPWGWHKSQTLFLRKYNKLKKIIK